MEYAQRLKVSPSMVVACLALLVGLEDTGIAAVNGVSPCFGNALVDRSFHLIVVC